MKEKSFPPGWNERRVRRVLSHYEKQTSQEAVVEDEAAFKGKEHAVIEVPVELMPVIREIIAQFRAKAKA